VAKPTQYWEKDHIQTKQYWETNPKASQIFTNNSFTTFLEGDYLLGYVLFFAMCMLILLFKGISKI
jgi:hypothetical protein